MGLQLYLLSDHKPIYVVPTRVLFLIDLDYTYDILFFRTTSYFGWIRASMVYVLIRLIFLSKTIVSSMNLNRIFQTFYPNNRITWYTFTAEISARVCQLYKIGDQFLIDTVNEGLRGMHKIGIFMYYKFTIVAALVGAHPEIWSQGGLNVEFITKTHNSREKFCFSSLSTLEFDDIQIFQLPRIFTINGISFYKLSSISIFHKFRYVIPNVHLIPH